MKHSLPVREYIDFCTYHRNPTAYEIKLGYGAIHYRDFTIDECCHKGTRIKKKWLIADDGNRYYS